MSDKERLLRKIQICDFALFDVSLYLDTHPSDTEALTFFNKHNKMRKEHAEEYTQKYGPLTHLDNKSKSTWEWVEGPWPWEQKKEVR